MNAIYPTHTCFDDALDMLAEAIKSNPGSAESKELKLVHAICLMPTGEEYSHAWVESFGNFVWFTGLLRGKKHQFVADIKEYYEDFRVQETTKYTPFEAWDLNNKHATYGPWEERYLNLCKRKAESR